jgi:DNA-binding transcriptional regulator YiaG
MREECSRCHADALLIWGSYRLDVGVPVKLTKIQLAKCPECGNVDPIIHNINDLLNTVALAIVCSPQKLNGREIKFLRKYVGKTAVEFGRLLHMDETHLSKVENDRTQIGDHSDKLVRFLVLNLSDELKNKAEALILALPRIDDTWTVVKPEILINIPTMDYEYAP